MNAIFVVKGGVSYDALLYGSFPDHEPDSARRDAMVYSSLGGLGFMKGYVLDTHFRYCISTTHFLLKQ
jgi:hypothetical protein